MQKNIAELPAEKQKAFVEFEAQAQIAFKKSYDNDRSDNSDQNGNYIGSYQPERSYVTKILAFLDEYSLETEIEDISDLQGDTFFRAFAKFISKVEYIVTRYELRSNRIESGTIGTLIEFAPSYKSDIGALLEKIRKIVNQGVTDARKKIKYSNVFRFYSQKLIVIRQP